MNLIVVGAQPVAYSRTVPVTVTQAVARHIQRFVGGPLSPGRPGRPLEPSRNPGWHPASSSWLGRTLNASRHLVT